MKVFLLAPALAAGLLLISSTASSSAFEGTAHLATNPPRKDGNETVTVSYKNAQGVTSSLPATVEGLNGVPSNSGDDAQTTESEKAQAMVSAINTASAAQGNPISATYVAPDGVVVSANNGGSINGITKTNDTREKDTRTLAPEATKVSVANYQLKGSVSGMNVLGGGGSSVWIGASGTEIQFSLTAAMDLDELRNEIANAFAEEGFRTGVIGDTVTIVLPASDPRASFDLDDATVSATFGITVL